MWRQDFKLKPIESEFYQLEDVIRRIADELGTSVKNEEIVRDTNGKEGGFGECCLESTLVRVIWFSVFSLVGLVGLGVWQLFYLKRFFKNKKLI